MVQTISNLFTLFSWTKRLLWLSSKGRKNLEILLLRFIYYESKMKSRWTSHSWRKQSPYLNFNEELESFLFDDFLDLPELKTVSALSHIKLELFDSYKIKMSNWFLTVPLSVPAQCQSFLWNNTWASYLLQPLRMPFCFMVSLIGL